MKYDLRTVLALPALFVALLVLSGCTEDPNTSVQGLSTADNTQLLTE